jgi:hypothetical protein
MLSRHYPQQDIDRFYAPLVGGPEQVAALRGRLTSLVHDPNLGDDPYERLKEAVVTTLADSVQNRVRQADDDPNIWHTLSQNGQSGSRLLVATAKAVGDLYVDQAAVPQHQPLVAKNTLAIVRHVQSLAFTGNLRAFANLSGMRFGTNPKNPLTYVAGLGRGAAPVIIHKPAVRKRAFRSTVDTEGQLHIEPRYSPLRQQGSVGCPAAFARVEYGDRSKNALALFAQIIGEVVVAEIFPNQFEITGLENSLISKVAPDE